MASRVQHNVANYNNSAQTQVQVTLTNVKAGSLIVITGNAPNPGTITCNDSNGTTVPVTSHTYGNTSQYAAYIWYVVNATAGTHTFTIAGPSFNYYEAYAVEYMGVVTSSPVDGSPASSAGSGTALSTGTITSVADGDLLFCCTASTGGAVSAAALTTVIGSPQSSISGRISERTYFGGAGSAQAATFTASTGDWVAVGVLFKSILTSLQGGGSDGVGDYLMNSSALNGGPQLGGSAPVVWGDFAMAPATVGTVYNMEWVLENEGGVSFAVQSGTLPTGLSLSNITTAGGRLSGTPTVAATYTFTLRATNSSGTADKTFTIIVSPASGSASEHAYPFIS